MEAIAKLPPCNKDTLAFMILHLQRVASNSVANKMHLSNIATVFAPTIVGSGVAKPTGADLIRDVKYQPKVSVVNDTKFIYSRVYLWYCGRVELKVTSKILYFNIKWDYSLRILDLARLSSRVEPPLSGPLTCGHLLYWAAFRC